MATGLLAGLGAFGVWIWFRVPFLANPLFVAETLRQGTLTRSQLETATLLLPVLFWLVIALIALVIGLGFLFTAIEKRYLTFLKDHDH
ncbi:hypothetical protein [Methylomarinovum caldicuralii]|uniref:hypothetical protein n=1 Tax=Methylomarinovum caldicuralii TaxID=438856 RepID=UPI0029537E87|nr:hypothetical protein [Methylomarinovum caldicuralii]